MRPFHLLYTWRYFKDRVTLRQLVFKNLRTLWYLLKKNYYSLKGK
ncbi:MAG: hypothetical protein PHI63_05905 [Patescibacteria group bacterium]|nr:hypothetical protein [Patescibacteria group bacterium]